MPTFPHSTAPQPLASALATLVRRRAVAADRGRSGAVTEASVRRGWPGGGVLRLGLDDTRREADAAHLTQPVRAGGAPARSLAS